MADHFTEAGHDATHVVRIGLRGASDPEVLARAATEDRILSTTDTDFPTLPPSGEPIPSVMLLRGISDSIQGRLAVGSSGAAGVNMTPDTSASMWRWTMTAIAQAPLHRTAIAGEGSVGGRARRVKRRPTGANRVSNLGDAVDREDALVLPCRPTLHRCPRPQPTTAPPREDPRARRARVPAPPPPVVGATRPRPHRAPR
jgi:hypothetical protein